MKNIRKYIVLSILIVMSINNVSSEINEGFISSAPIIETEINKPDIMVASEKDMENLWIQNGAEAKDIQSVFMYMNNDYWTGSTNGYGKSDVLYNQSGNTVGTGYMYFWRVNTDSIPGYDTVYIKCYFDNGLDISDDTKQIIDIVGDVTSQIQTTTIDYDHYDDINHVDKFVGMGFDSPPQFHFFNGEHTSRIYKPFYNYYNWTYYENDELFEFNIVRNLGNTSMIKIINNGGVELINETSLQSTSIPVVSDDLINSTWYFTAIDNNGIGYSRTFIFIEDEISIIPTLTTDKLLYNTSEQITISFTNIDEIEGYEIERLSLYILYPIIHESKDYDTKYMLHLLGDKRDETFTLNTTFLSPQNEYHLAICVDGDFHNIDDALIISDTFYVYDENEYLSTSCNPEGNCYTYNNNDITIYYRINNNSNIIIKDNEGNTIQTYYNIIDEGEINYHIPSDENKLNSYPNWKIYLNNTEYETNYSTDVTVYWSLFVTPTPTPIYTVDIPDENVTEQIDQLKEESKPIFDLIYGLTTLVIDNPDYDNDNIVDEHEINNWFNSLIPLGILLLLIILYMGLKKRD